MQRRKEYQQEIKEMQRRVKGRPLLLEQVAQVSITPYHRVQHFITISVQHSWVSETDEI